MKAGSYDGAARSGLPGPLPEGESIIWQGRPSPAAIARRALHARLIGLYFAGVAVFAAGMAWSESRPLASVAVSLALIAAAALVVMGFIWVMARLIARTTIYTITTRRVVMKIGVALPLTLNLPFAMIEGAGLKTYDDGTGDIPLALGGTGRVGFIHLWPHARPWRVNRPEPMLRGIPDAGRVAAILARAIGESTAAAGRAARPAPASTLQPALPAVAA